MLLCSRRHFLGVMSGLSGLLISTASVAEVNPATLVKRYKKVLAVGFRSLSLTKTTVRVGESVNFSAVIDTRGSYFDYEHYVEPPGTDLESTTGQDETGSWVVQGSIICAVEGEGQLEAVKEITGIKYSVNGFDETGVPLQSQSPPVKSAGLKRLVLISYDSTIAAGFTAT